MKKINLDNIKAIFVSPGLGKTFLAETDSRFIDMDLEHTKETHLFKNDITPSEVERLKGTGFPKNPNWSFEKENEKMLSYIQSGKIALHAPYEECMEFLFERNIPFALVSAHPSMLNEIKIRAKNRGNVERIVNIISSYEFVYTNFKKHKKDRRPVVKIYLKKGFVGDLI